VSHNRFGADRSCSAGAAKEDTATYLKTAERFAEPGIDQIDVGPLPGDPDPVGFIKPLNQMTAAIPLIIGIADFTWQAGDLTFTGIALGSIAALLVYHGMRLLSAARGESPQRCT
jgi:hypothetical protein